jgi:hypothetical protein
VFKRTHLQVSLDPKELQDLLDELKASRISRKTAWDILQELRSILNEHGVILAPPAVKNIGVEGRLLRDGVRKALANRRTVIEDLIKAIGEYRKSGGGHQSVHALNNALERAELLLS